MPLSLVRFLALVIALVVPIQGMAAVMAAQCMAFGHHQGAAGHGSHGDADEGQGDHDHAMHSHQDDATGNDGADESGSNGSHCGPCTACCASASIAGPAALSILSLASNAPYVSLQFAPPSVPLDGLDRPPTAL
jgi:hypothetical protein